VSAQEQTLNSTEGSARELDKKGAQGETGEQKQVPVSTSGPSPSNSLAQFSVRLEFFSGPMDLLLHLVSQQEVSIEQVKMSVIAEQYLEIVSSVSSVGAESLDLDAATEYLVIAATLLAIKSRSLLPSERDGEEEENDNDTWESNRFFEDLRSRLKAYEVTKHRASALMKSPQLGFDTFRREDRKALQPTPEMLGEPEDVHSFTLLFAKLLKRVGGAGKSLRVALEPISVVSSMMNVIEILGHSVSVGKNSSETISKEPLSLKALFKRIVPKRVLLQIKNQESREAALEEAKGVIIGSFIASLELLKRGVLCSNGVGESDEYSLQLQIDPAEDPFDSGALVSEFDDQNESIGDESISSDEDESTDPRHDNDKVVPMSKYRDRSDARAPYARAIGSQVVDEYQAEESKDSQDSMEEADSLQERKKEVIGG